MFEPRTHIQCGLSMIRTATGRSLLTATHGCPIRGTTYKRDYLIPNYLPTIKERQKNLSEAGALCTILTKLLLDLVKVYFGIGEGREGGTDEPALWAAGREGGWEHDDGCSSRRWDQAREKKPL